LVNGFYTLATGRYIAEVRLTNPSGYIAFRREVIEIWPNTFTAFAFEPLVFLDPNAILPNSQAVLCETTSIVGGSIIGIGNGSGLDESDPKIYNCYQINESIILFFEQESLFSTTSWVANAGNAPEGLYPNTGHPPANINFSTDNVLWVKAVSEDRNKTMYYKFILQQPVNYGDFSIGIGSSDVSWSDGILTINTSGSYTIGMKAGVNSTTTNRIVVESGVTADIILSNVNINMSSINNARAFDMTGATVNLTLVGGNVLRSGQNRAGLEAPEGSSLVITAASTGSLSATGGNSGAGIGGGSGGVGGSVSISGGTVTATGGNSGAGIGSGSNGDGGTITEITGNAVVFASSIQSELPTGASMGPAIVFNGINGNMYGNVSLTRNVTIPSGRILSIASGQTLTIQSGYALTNNGTIINSGNIQGTVIGNSPVEPSLVVYGGSAYT
jgi:hypothetical protein